jgi:hypothetical protein
MSRTEPENEKLRELYSAPGGEAARTPACPDDGEIWAASRGELSPERSHELLAHALECAACEESWRVARTLAAEAGLGAAATVLPFRTDRRKVAVLLAAAAVLALALIVIPRVAWKDGSGAGSTWAEGVNTTLWRVGGDGDSPLVEGDSVRPGDRIYLTLDTDAPAYVYLINRDQTGESTALFPIEGAQWSNPLPAGSAHRLPGDTDWQYDSWEVSSAGGRESFIVVASAKPLVQLETAIALLEAAGPVDEFTRGQDPPVRDPRTDPEQGEDALSAALQDLTSRAAGGELILRQIVLENPR